MTRCMPARARLTVFLRVNLPSSAPPTVWLYFLPPTVVSTMSRLNSAQLLRIRWSAKLPRALLVATEIPRHALESRVPRSGDRFIC